MAINVARRESVNRTAQQLHLDAGKLKRLLVAADSGQRKRQNQPRFVELIGPSPVAGTGCVIEFETAAGSKRRIHSKTAALLHRKNALFYRTLNGAQVGDLFMSLIHTCQLCGANSFDYLVELQRHAQKLAVNRAEWMPWNYRETLTRS